MLKNLLTTTLLALATAVGSIHAASTDPVLVTDIATSPTIEHSDPEQFIPVNDRVFFYATTRQHGRELWVSDGLQTNLVKDIYPGSQSSIPDTFLYDDYFGSFNNELYFMAVCAIEYS